MRVTAGGTLLAVADQHGQSSSTLGSDFAVTIQPDGSGAPILFEVGLSCGGATATKHYRATPDAIRYDVIALA